MRSFAGAMKALILILFIVSGVTSALADPPKNVTGSAFVTDTSAPWDGIAKIGDTISFTAYFDSDIAPTNAFAVVPGVNNPNISLSISQIGGASYTANANWTVLQGLANNVNQELRFLIGNASGSINVNLPAVTYKLDNVRPERDGIMTAKVDGVDYTGLPVRKGQKVTFTQKLSTGDSSQEATLNLSSVGLVAANPMTIDGSLPPAAPTFTLSNVVFPEGRDNAYTFPININDGRGNISLFNDFTMNVDTSPPLINSVSVTNAAGANVIALPGHILNFSVTIQNADGDIASVTNASFGSANIALPSLTRNAAGTTFTGSMVLPSDNTIFGSPYPFEFRITDNADNVTTATALLFGIDLTDITQSLASAAVYPPAPAISPVTTVASIGTRLQFRSEITSQDVLAVTVNLTSIGGPASYVMPLVSDPGTNPRTYIGTYTLTTATPLDGSYMNFVIYGKSPSGNLVFKTTTPDILIDNVPPAITALTLTRAAGAGTIIAGDLVTVQATVTNVNSALGGKVWVDLSALGGSTTAALTNENLNFWRTTITVASGSIDASKFFKVYAWDSEEVKNQTTFDSVSTLIDTEPPVVTLATWSVSPLLVGAHTHVNNGDQLKFEVKLASSTLSTPFDGQTVFIDLSSAGGPANQQMTLLANETYTYTFTVPLGPLTDGATFPLIIRDDATNRPYSEQSNVAWQPIIASITIPAFDQAVPVISAFTLTRDAGAGTIHIGDAVTFQATVNGILSGGVVWSDLRSIGVTDSASYTFSNVSGNTWQAKVTVGSGALDINNATFTVYAYNRVDHQTSFGSIGYTIDNIPPFLVTATYTSNPIQGTTHPYVKIGDQITLSVELDPAMPNDGHTVSVNLSGLGSGTASLTPTLPYDGTFSLTFTLATGTTNGGIILPLTIRDNANNPPFDSTDEYPVNASITIDLLDQLHPTINSFTVSRDAGAGIIIINDAITFNASVSNVDAADGGGVWLDLRRLGGPASATFTNTGGDSWQYNHVVGTGSVGFPPIDRNDYVFTLHAFDKASNTFSLNSAPTSIDNIAPELTDTVVCTWTPVLPRKNAPYMIIGDRFHIEVQLKAPDDSHEVKVDLSSLGNLGTQTLKLLGGVYKTENPVVIATGPLNLGATFTITIRDNAGNGPVWGPASAAFDASATIPLLDQNPPDPGMLTLAVFRYDDKIADPLDLATIVNTHKELTFTLPYTAESSNDDHATAAVHLWPVGSDLSGIEGYVDISSSTVPATATSWFGKMSDMGGSYELKFNTASLSENLYKYPHQFAATMFDASGNRTQVKTADAIKYHVDCYPPRIASISVSVVGGGVAHIGSRLRFRVEAQHNVDDGPPVSTINPQLDLASLGISTPITMSVSSPSGWYQYEHTVAAGDFNNDLASWVITVQDGGRNFVASHTNEITIDNQIPLIDGEMDVSWDDTPENDDKIKYNDLVTWTVSLPSETNLGTATIDLRAVGGPAAAQMVKDDIAKTFTLATSTLPTSAEYASYKFTASVSDGYGNEVTVRSRAITSVDCQPASFSASIRGINILNTNGDNPVTGVANINDVLLVFASVTAHLDSLASATLISGSTHIATAPLTFNPATGRHEAQFIVGDTGGWSDLNNPITCYLDATDDANNIATQTYYNSTFRVKTRKPVLAGPAEFFLPTNNDVKTRDGYLVLNIASGAPADLLIASATLADGETVHSAWIDFSSILGATSTWKLPAAALNAPTVSVASMSVSHGFKASDLPKIDNINGSTVDFVMALQDEAGYIATGSQTFYVDTGSPTITGARFDGTTLSLDFSEEFEAPVEALWRLIGSQTTPVNELASMSLGNALYATADWSPGWQAAEFDLTLEGRKNIAGWASTPLYLEVLASNAAPLKDTYGNWLMPVSRLPITITDSSFREKVKITSLVMTHTWPASITLDFTFNKPMASATLVASDAVLFVDAPTSSVATPFSQVDYRHAYCFQASDTVSWPSDTKMRIILCTDGRDWVVRKLGNGSKTLKFAQRNTSKVFVKDDLNRELSYYAWNSPFVAVDNRGTTQIAPLEINSSDPTPALSLSSGTLTLGFTDRALLFSDNYKSSDNASWPAISPPKPNTPFNSFKSRIHLYNLADTSLNSFITLSCDDLQPAENELASTTATIRLTAGDILNIINFYKTSVNPQWGLKIDAGAFINMWGMNNSPYLPLDPGNVDVSTMTVGVPASIVACAVSDMPPTKQDTGNFIFEFELLPGKTAEGIEIPFAAGITPKAAIFVQGETDRLASGTFTGWSTREVDGTERVIAAFKTSEGFRTAVDYGTPSQLELFGLKDIFDNPVTGMVASSVYDRATRITTGSGFSTSPASFTVDNILPTVVSIEPHDVIGVTNGNAGLFKINFSEPMDTAVAKRPGLSLATSTETINFVFSGWENGNRRAVYRNLQAITVGTPNGTWTYTISGGADTAGNAFVTDTREVRILSDAPPVAPGGVALKTIQHTINPAVELLNQPFSLAGVATAGLSITYQKIPTENLPHLVRFYDANNLMIGSASVVMIGPDTAATATIDSSNFIPALGNVGPLPITVKMVDNAGNLTGSLLEMIYDASAPVLNSFELAGAATFSQGVYYYNSLSLGNLTAVAGSSATDPLRLTIASETVLATATLDMTRSSNYSVSFGRSLPPTLAPGTYSLRVTDAAGNMHTGSGSITLRVDNTPPTIATISPSMPLGVIGITAAGMATFTVTFSEPMDNMASPTLELATSSRTILMDFIGWADTTIATTAYFVNRYAIDVLHPAGVYSYRITNPETVRDLAANPLNPAGSFSLNVQSKGPAASVDILSFQSDIFGITPLTNSHYSTLVAPAGTATIQLAYSGAPLNWPHQLLVYSPTKVNVATLTIDPALHTADFPGDLASWTASASPALDGHYYFKLVDNLGNIGPETGYLDRSLYLDRASATVNTLTFNDGGFGILSGGIRYFSPVALKGSATGTLTTLATDSIRLVVASGTATHTFDLASATTTHTGQMGGNLPDGLYTVSTADFAGNFSAGATSTFQLMVDTSQPAVVAASPSTMIGAVAANGGSFQVVFSEPMQTAGATPTAYLASTTFLSKEAPLKFVGWSDAYTANFVSEKAIDDSFGPGTYSYIIAGARDYAGNIATTTAPGSFTVQIYSKKPVFDATLTSRQHLISGNTDLVNTLVAYFSPNVAPGVATLTVAYREGPYSTPHQLKLYDATNVLVKTIDLTASGSEGIASVDAAFFNNPAPATYSILHGFNVIDTLGNTSASSTLKLVYDAVGPDVSSLTLTGISPASVKPLYYHNPALHGDLLTTVDTDDASGPIRLVLVRIGVATKTYQMTSVASNMRYSYAMTAADNSKEALEDGSYYMTVVDGAGNFATGAEAAAGLVIDRIAPTLISTQLSTGAYLSSGAAGAATFTLTFDEPLYGNATPTLSIATLSASIPCVCATFSGNIATFTTAATISNTLPQGEYTLNITATDLTGNLFSGASGTVQVRSRGPVIAAWHTTSQQFTTASGSETLTNQPFSFNVAPAESTIFVTLQALPEGLKDDIRLHFTSAGTTIASYPLSWSELVGTFTWNAATGPATATAYNVYLYDGNGDASLETMVWELDNTRPTVASLTVSGGEVNHASATVYFNPQRHSGVTTRFQVAGETAAPKLRVRSQVSTDTYELQAAGTGFWSTAFTGYYSRVSQLMPDGVYQIGLADRAGNMAASGSEDLYTIVIDTKGPDVSTYAATIAGRPAAWFAPSAGNLEITVTSTDPLTASGVYYLDVTNIAGARINRLPLVASAAGYVASWNGRNAFGNLVGDGEHTFRATDYAGNTATAAIKVTVITSEFRATHITQISSTSAKIWFNQELESSSITGTSVVASPAMVITQVQKVEQQAILFKTAGSFEHDKIYAFNLASGTSGVRSIYGATLASTTNQVDFKADGRGPSIVDYSFSGLSGQREVKIIFNEAIESTSAARTGSYSLKDETGARIDITLAAVEPDQISARLTAAADLVDSKLYTIIATGVTDIYGNPGTGNSLQFRGRDLTPPTIHVSAFSNPANVYDIIVIASTSEKLAAAPTLYVKHGSASTINMTMQVHSNQQLFMAGVSLRSSKALNGSLTVVGEDLSGNQGRGEGTFTIAEVGASIRAQILSADQVVELAFAENSLKEDAVVKILKHRLSQPDADNQTIAPAMQQEMKAAAGLRSAKISGNDIQNSSELTPISEGYEISIDKEKVAEGFGLAFKAPATSTAGLGLFNQSGNSWKFVTAATNGDGAFTARLTSSQIMAVMHDMAAPRINMAADLDFSEPLRNSRPEFRGQIKEYGAGLDPENIFATIDGGTAQPVSVDSAGNFIFKPLSPLTNGDHELVINAADRTGNHSRTSAIRFQVALPLQVGQIMQYPNPARNRGFIRISANSKDLTDDLVTIKIYDTAGHKVTSLGGVRAVQENFAAGGSRYLYDIAWDLRNEAGKAVANGVYIARIEVRDPLNPTQKVKKTCKLAVLR